MPAPNGDWQYHLGDRRHASKSRPGRRCRPNAWQWRRIALQQRLQCALCVRRLPKLRILSGRSIQLEGNVPSFPPRCGKRFGRLAACIEVTSWQAMPPDRMAMAAHCPPAMPAMRLACPAAAHAENSERSQHPTGGKRAIVSTSLRQAFWRPAACIEVTSGRRCHPTAWQWRRIALQQHLQCALRVRRLPTLRNLSGRSIQLEGNVPSFPAYCGKRFGRLAACIEVTSWQAMPHDHMAMAAHCPPAMPAMRLACPTAAHAEDSERSQHPTGGKRAIVSTSLRQAF